MEVAVAQPTFGVPVDLPSAYLSGAAAATQEVVMDTTRGGVVFDGQALGVGATRFGVRGTAGILGLEITDTEGIIRAPQRFAGLTSGLRSILFDTDLTLMDNLNSIAAFRFDILNNVPRLNVYPNGVIKTGIGDIINLDTAIAINFAAGTMSSFIRFGSIVSFLQAANPFGMGPLFNAAGTFQNDPSVAVNLGTALTYVSQNTYRANAQAIALAGVMRDIISQPTFQGVSGGTLSISSMTHFFSAGQILVGATATTRRVLEVNDPTGTTGVLTNSIGIDFDAGAPFGGFGTNRTALNSAMNSPAVWINHTGTGAMVMGGLGAAIGFLGAAAIARPAVAGAWAGNAAGAALSAALAALGLITDNTTP